MSYERIGHKNGNGVIPGTNQKKSITHFLDLEEQNRNLLTHPTMPDGHE